MTRPCDIHELGDPLCHYPDTFFGRVELRDGPDFGEVSGSWHLTREERVFDALSTIWPTILALWVIVIASLIIR